MNTSKLFHIKKSDEQRFTRFELVCNGVVISTRASIEECLLSIKCLMIEGKKYFETMPVLQAIATGLQENIIKYEQKDYTGLLGLEQRQLERIEQAIRAQYK